MTCAHCNGTGSLSKQLDGYLDCVHCDAAEERAKLESWSKGQLAVAPSAAAWAWMIYLHGKSAALST